MAWDVDGIVCLDERGYKNFEWLLLEFDRWKTMANDRLDHFENLCG